MVIGLPPPPSSVTFGGGSHTVANLSIGVGSDAFVTEVMSLDTNVTNHGTFWMNDHTDLMANVTNNGTLALETGNLLLGPACTFTNNGLLRISEDNWVTGTGLVKNNGQFTKLVGSGITQFNPSYEQSATGGLLVAGGRSSSTRTRRSSPT